jgi:DNA repair protein RecN (Recombination protein N)
MLTELCIRNFAIIEDLSLDFGPGFVVFTGETGAGKSIIIDAVEMLLGERAESTMVRSGVDTALIEGTFQIDPAVQSDVLHVLEHEALLDDPEILTLGREIRRQGRNISRVNGRTVNVGLMRDLGAWLVDVHGQSEHLSLLRVREHLNLLDRFARVEGLRNAFAQGYETLSRVRRELTELRQEEHDAARRADLLGFQINEIEAAALRPGEESELREERTRLANAEQLATLAEQAVMALDEGHQNQAAASDLLGQAAHALAALAKVDASMQAIQVEAQALLEQAGELARRLRVYRESIEFNPRRLDEVQDRLGLIGQLQRKYGGTVEAVLEHAGRARQELQSITHAEERIQELVAEEAALLARLGEIGSDLSRARREAAERLASAIEAELADLRMAGARFGVDMRWKDDLSGAPLGDRRVAFDPSGMDQVEFLVAPNPGESLKPLVKIGLRLAAHHHRQLCDAGFAFHQEG